MRAFQFWILVLGSTLVSILMIKQIFLNRSINEERRLLAESQQTFSEGGNFENAWKQLAMHIYQTGKDDPALIDVLKKANIDVHPTPNPNAVSTPAPTPSASPNPPATP